jgi:hypothetical protein
MRKKSHLLQMLNGGVFKVRNRHIGNFSFVRKNRDRRICFGKAAVAREEKTLSSFLTNYHLLE